MRIRGRTADIAVSCVGQVRCRKDFKTFKSNKLSVLIPTAFNLNSTAAVDECEMD